MHKDGETNRTYCAKLNSHTASERKKKREGDLNERAYDVFSESW